jgi:hypothetical protein
MDLYLLSFSSTGSTFNSSNISSFILQSKWCTRLYFGKIQSRLMSILLYPFFQWSKFHFHIKERGEPVQGVVK